MKRLKKGLMLLIGFDFLALSIYFFYLESTDSSGDLGIEQLLFGGGFMVIGLISAVFGFVLMSSVFKKKEDNCFDDLM